MPLIRVSEKKLAANRANARLSRGPSTPHGKERSSRNACKHHLYAKKHQLPPAWEDRIHDLIAPCAAAVDDPLERARLVHYLVLNQWIVELISYEARLLNQSIARHHDYTRGVHDFAVHDPRFLAIEARRHYLHVQANRARAEWLRIQSKNALKQTTPKLAQNKPLVMAAAAGIGPIACSGPARPTLLVEATQARSNPDHNVRRTLRQPTRLWYHRMRHPACHFFEQLTPRNRLRNQ